ncbi:MAG: hypothetical protein M1837_006359 [Sclerophora amabilis]|nr:MAG: hypothetical protein M1837_006359 [Sclerophora amabilis]
MPHKTRTYQSFHTETSKYPDIYAEYRGASVENAADHHDVVLKDEPFREIKAAARASNKSTAKRNDLHPYVRPLTLSDVESCVTMEAHSFSENERCTRDKIIYRLTKSSELSLGLFATASSGSRLAQDVTATSALPVDSARPERKEVLIGMIVATKCRDRTVDDDAMAYPPDYKEAHPQPSPLGHQEEGRTIALHSLAVLPRHRGKGMGRTILTSFVQRMASAGTADRISLIAHDYLIKFYNKFGFENVGQSTAQFGGGGWHDFIIECEDVRKGAL